jgi:hypothetical protein
MIRAALPSAPKEQQYDVGLGAHILNGEAVFNTGNEIIRFQPNKKNSHIIALNSQGFNLDVDPNLSEREAVANMLKIVNLGSDAGRVIFSHSLLYVKRKVYEVAWRSPVCSLFFYDGTGQSKTTYVTFLTQLHNRIRGIESPTRLNASIAAAEEILYEKSDCTVVFDDLVPSDFHETKSKQEKLLLGITRIIGDGIGRARMNGKKVKNRKPSVGVVFTGEYLIGEGSDAARLLPLQFTTPIDDVKFKECQNKPLVVSTFYRFYIKWYIANFDMIKTLLEGWWDKYTRIDMHVHKRLRETHFFINSAYKLFMRYCVEKGFTTSEKANEAHRSFEDFLTKLVRMQNERVKLKRNNTANDENIFEFIRKLYKSKSFNLAKNVKRLHGCDGLKYNGMLCLCSDKLLQKIRDEFPDAKYSDIKHSLISKNALKLDREGKNYKIGNTRFCAIYLRKLD